MGMNGAGGAAAEGCSLRGPHRVERRAGDGDALSRPTIQLRSLQLPLPTSHPQAAIWSPTWALGQDEHVGGQSGSGIQLPAGAGAEAGTNLGAVQGWNPRKTMNVGTPR